MAGLASGAQGGVGNMALDRMLTARNAVVPRNTRIAVFGPSHAANHFNQAANTTTGQGALASASTQGPVNWANFLSGGAAVLEAADSFGYNGDWTDAATYNGTAYPGMLSRVDAVIASGAGHVVMVAPTANDRNAWTAAQSIAALDEIIARIVRAGMLLTILLDYPHGDASNTALTLPNASATPQLDHWHKVNRSLWARHGQNGVYIVDTPALIGDLTSGAGRALAGMLIDGLHLTQLGAFTIGRALARRWRQIYAPVGVLPFAASERANQAGVNDRPILTQNPYFGGSGGTLGSGTGVLGDGWSTTLSAGVAAAYAKATTTAFAGTTYADHGERPAKDWQQISLSGTATAADEVMLIRQSVGCTPGDMLRAVAEIEVDAGMTGIAGVELFIWQSAGGSPTYSQVRALAIPTALAGQSWPNYPIAGVLRTPRWTNESGQFHLTLAVRPIVGGTMSGTIRVRGLAAGKALV